MLFPSSQIAFGWALSVNTASTIFIATLRAWEALAGLGTTNYLYDGNASVEEVDGAGSVVTRYADGEVLDETLAELRSGATSYYQQDALGSVTSLSTPSAGLSNTYTFDSFGKLTTSTGNISNPFQYTGRESDPETGVYYYRARYYDPASGRFLSADPIRFHAGPNFYSYVQNAPIEAGGGRSAGVSADEL